MLETSENENTPCTKTKMAKNKAKTALAFKKQADTENTDLVLSNHNKAMEIDKESPSTSLLQPLSHSTPNLKRLEKSTIVSPITSNMLLVDRIDELENKLEKAQQKVVELGKKNTALQQVIVDMAMPRKENKICCKNFEDGSKLFTKSNVLISSA